MCGHSGLSHIHLLIRQTDLPRSRCIWYNHRLCYTGADCPCRLMHGSGKHRFTVNKRNSRRGQVENSQFLLQTHQSDKLHLLCRETLAVWANTFPSWGIDYTISPWTQEGVAGGNMSWQSARFGDRWISNPHTQVVPLGLVLCGGDFLRLGGWWHVFFDSS